jgi:putative salt-induced outer membrane protein
MVRRALLAIVFSIIPCVSVAQGDDAIGWSGVFELNGSTSSGNNDTTNVGTRIQLKRRGYDWRHSFAGSADYGEASGNTNKERFRVSYKIGRDLSERSYAYLNTDYFSDDFGAYKQGYFAGGGIGYTVSAEGPTLWKLETGAGYRSQKARLKPASPVDLVSRKERFASTRMFSELEYDLNDKVSVTNDTELFYSAIDTYVVNEAAVTSAMFGDLALRASFRVESHSDVPEGREKTDTVSRLGIVYKMN